MDIQVIEMPPISVIGMRKEGSYTIIPGMIRDLKLYAEKAGVTVNGHPMFLSHELTKEKAMEADREGKADVEVCLPVDGFVRSDNLVRYYMLPGQKMARIVHQGPYERADRTYQELFQWVSKNNRRICGSIREVYVNDPKEVTKDDLLTEIYAPIE